jgi:hypothetical protein
VENPQSRFRNLLESERAVLEHVWSDQHWRKVRILRGRAIDKGDPRPNDGESSEQLLAHVSHR